MTKKSETRNSLKTLKYSNRKTVLNYLRNSGAVSVNQISRDTGLSKMTVHKIIDHYLEDGMIAPAGKGESTEEGGKKPNLFAFNADCRYIFAVRLGGSFLSTSVVNLRGDPLAEPRRVALVNADFEEVVKLIGDEFVGQLAAGGLEADRCFATVVGCNGVVDAGSGVFLAPYQHPGWGTNVPFRECLEAFLPPNVPIHVDSWWRHLAHGEVRARRHSDGRNFFLIGNSGDCVSGGLVVDGQAFRGSTGFAGEIGHMIVAPTSGRSCVCGGRGCLEVLVAPVTVMRRAEELRGEYPDSLVFADAGEAAGIPAVGSAADRGDALARRLLDEVVGHFSVAINNIIVLCDPGKVIFFGDYARCGEYFLRELRARAGSLTMHGIDKRTEIEVSALGDDHGAAGAANHMADKLFADH